MSYKVTVENRYKDGSELKVEFDTNSKLLHEASKDAQVEVFTVRMHQRKNEWETPVFSKVTYRPI